MTEETVPSLLRGPIDDVVLRTECCEHWSDLADRVLKIVVHCDDDIVAGCPNTAEQCIVLTVISAHPNAPHAGIRSREAVNE